MRLDPPMHRLLMALAASLTAIAAGHASAAPLKGCHAFKADSTGQYLSHNGDLAWTVADRSTVGPWEKFCVVPTPDGSQLIQDERGRYLSSRGGGVVQRAWVPRDFERWQIDRAADGSYGIASRAHDGWLSAVVGVQGIGRGVVSLKGERRDWERWRLEPAQGCACTSENEADIATDVVPRPRTGPVFGIADTHAHPFSNLGFGGTTIHGDVSSPLGLHGAMSTCSFTHGIDSKFDPLGGILNERLHSSTGLPGLADWPAYDMVNHQQMYHAWMERAWRGGVRLQVMLAVHNKVLCHLTKVTAAAAYAASSVGAIVQGTHPPPPPDLGRSCDDMDAATRQFDAAKALEAYIDAQSGGAGKGWYRIAYSPAQARTIIESGKMAVVLGIEVDTLFGCTATGPCDPEDVERQLDRLYDQGVRHVFPVHLLDNAFGGAAQYNPIFLAANIFENGQPYAIQGCDDPTLKMRFEWVDAGPVCDYLGKIPGLGPELQDVCRGRPPPGMNPIPPTGGHCNARGLTKLGERLINRLMDKGMIIDTDHMSARSLEGTLAIAEARDHPLVSGHTGLVERTEMPGESYMAARDIERFRRLGGLVSPILFSGKSLDELKPYGDKVPHACAGSTTSWAQNYLYTVDAMGGPDVAAVPIGSDINGMISQPVPRFGPHACHGNENSTPENPSTRVVYPFRAQGEAGTFGQLVTAGRTYDYNVDGLANVGLLPDWIEDLRAVGLGDRELAPLLRSAEGYLKMWEKADRKRSGYTRVPLSERPSMNWDNAAAYCAAQGKRLANQREICPRGLDDSPRFGRPEGDVWMAVGDAPNAWMSIGTRYPERQCKLHRQSIGTPPAWGLDRGPEPHTQQPTALRCVDYERVPLGTGDPARATFNWDDARKMCEDHGLRLATRGDICPDGPDGEPAYGRVPGDVWLPVNDHQNAWLSVGEMYAAQRKCGLHREIYESAPAWGLQKGPEPATSRTPAAVVCLPRK